MVPIVGKLGDAPLGVITVDENGNVTILVSDCRNKFDTVADLTHVNQ